MSENTNQTANQTPPDFATRWVNLGSEKLGAKAVACSDDFFAPMQRMLQDAAPIFIDGKYDDNGKWMDGWESRRKRSEGHDWCVVQLARPGVLRGVEVDTTHFTGNYPPAASLEACHCATDAPEIEANWQEIIPQTELRGDAQRAFAVTSDAIYTHVRLNIFPDGGVARLRLYGAPQVDWDRLKKDELVDLAAALNGGVALYCNDEHFGSVRNILTPGPGVNMGDGWETRRRREPGNDWAVIALAAAGVVREIRVDTAHFKGNYPDRCSVQGAKIDPTTSAQQIVAQSQNWREILPAQKLQADREHHFADEVLAAEAVTHIRLNIYPDGGVSRLRILATVAK